MKLTDDAFALRCRHERDVEAVDQPTQLAGERTTASANHQERSRGAGQPARGLFDHVARCARRKIARRRFDQRQRRGGAPELNREHEQRGSGVARVFGGAERGQALRSRSFCLGYADGSARDVGQHLLHGDAFRAAVLQQATTVGCPRDIPADEQHGNAFQVCRDDASDDIGRARTRGHDHRWNSAGCSVVVGSGESRRRFVPRLDQACARGAQDGVEDRRYGAAWNAEEGLDSGIDQGPDEPMRCGCVGLGFARGLARRRAWTTHLGVSSWSQFRDVRFRRFVTVRVLFGGIDFYLG
jgi:hypothetical protein